MGAPNNRTKRSLIIWSIVIVVFIIALLAVLRGCGGDDKKDTGVKTPSPDTSSSVKTVSEIKEIDYDTLGNDYVDTELTVKVSSKTSIYMKGQLFYVLKVSVIEEELMYFVNVSRFKETKIGDRFTATVRTYTNSSGTKVKSIINMTSN